MSIACSTEEALKWDPEWANTHEISGRAMKDVHSAGNQFNVNRCDLLLPAVTSQGLLKHCCFVPQLFQKGESCKQAMSHSLQHPHADAGKASDCPIPRERLRVLFLTKRPTIEAHN